MDERLCAGIQASSDTVTDASQRETEELLEDYISSSQEPMLLRNKHSRFVSGNLGVLPSNIQGLHCSQPWLLYWTLHASDLLGITPQVLQATSAKSIAKMLMQCFVLDVDSDGTRRGGFAGGPFQLPHLATTYAAVCALTILNDSSVLEALDRDALCSWFLSLRRDDGGYCVHHGGESDIRASYCVAVVAALLNLPHQDILLGDVCADFVLRCQTYEGGMACSPISSEAHGGYTQCGLAALLLMQKFHHLDVPSLRRWLCSRQFEYEGGFSGRTNKLVDSCYSHWIGTSFVLLRIGEAATKCLRSPSGAEGPVTARDMFALDLAQLVDLDNIYVSSETIGQLDEQESLHQRQCLVTDAVMGMPCGAGGSPSTTEEADGYADESFLDEGVGDYLFNQRKLQHYVLHCCQNQAKGGLMDKPGHPNDFYHTCYAMSGLSSAQNLQYLSPRTSSTIGVEEHSKSYVGLARERKWIPGAPEHGVVLPTDPTKVAANHEKLNILRASNPIVNITKEKVLNALKSQRRRTLL